MRNTLVLCVFFLMLSLFGTGYGTNVKDFGAKGDGVTDDTAAIEKASLAAARYAATLRSKAGYRFNRGQIGDGPQQEIIFPEGVYRVTRPVAFLRDAVLRGIGKAILRQDDPKQDILYFHNAFRCRIENLSFEGGATQLRVWTNNNDSANLLVRNCRFRNASKSAVECLSFRLPDAGGKWKPASPYQMKDGVILGPADLSKAERFANSTLFMIEECVFDNCRRAADIACDGSVIRNSKAVSARDFTGGVFRLSNKTHLYNLDILIRRDPARKQSALECYSRITLCFNDSVIRTDNGMGVCAVVSEGKPEYVGSSIILRNLKSESGPSPENAVLFLAKGTIPNSISIDGITETSARKVKAVGFESEPTEKTLSDLRRFKGFSNAQTYSFALGKNAQNVDSSLPEVLRKYQVPFPEIRKPFERPALPHFRGKIFYARDFGVDSNPETDDTAAVKKMFAEAGKHPGSTVVFPGTWILLSDTVEVPGNLAVNSSGRTAFRMKDTEKTLFLLKNPECVQFSNLFFQDGKHAVSIESHPSKQGSIFFDNCYFYDFSSYAVHMAADKRTDTPAPLRILMNGGVSFTAKLYGGNASLVYSDAQWFSTLPEGPKELPAKECSAFRNDGGNFEIVDFLGVPMAFAWISRDAPVPKETRPSDCRWIDNAGNLHCFNARFGGEWGGICPVFHSGNGFVTMEGAYAWFETSRILCFPIVADSASGHFELFNVQCSPTWEKPRWNVSGAMQTGQFIRSVTRRSSMFFPDVEASPKGMRTSPPEEPPLLRRLFGNHCSRRKLSAAMTPANGKYRIGPENIAFQRTR